MKLHGLLAALVAVLSYAAAQDSVTIHSSSGLAGALRDGAKVIVVKGVMAATMTFLAILGSRRRPQPFRLICGITCPAAEGWKAR